MPSKPWGWRSSRCRRRTWRSPRDRSPLTIGAISTPMTADYESLPAMAGTVDGNSFQGRSGIEAYFADVDKAWEEFLLHPDDVHDLGDRVLILGRSQGRGRTSGVPIVAEW